MYWSLKKFNIENFNSILRYKLENLSNFQITLILNMKKSFLDELNRHVPLKKKILRHNNNAFVTKYLWKEIMLKSILKNKFIKETSHIN